MKAYLINPTKNEITEVKHNGDYKSIYPLIDAQTFDVARVEPNGDSVYIDDEGLLHLTASSRFFTYEGFHSPLAGKGLVLGLNQRTGKSVSVKTPIETVRAKVKFYSLNEVRKTVC